MPYCRDCGARIQSVDAYCYECGAVQPMPADPEPEGNYEPADEPGQGVFPGQPQGPRPPGGDSARRSNRDGPTGSRKSREYSRQYRRRPSRVGQHEAGYERHGKNRSDGSFQQGSHLASSRAEHRLRAGSTIDEGKLAYAFSFPRSSGNSPILAGSVCLFLSVLLIPVFSLFGYSYRLTKAATNGRQLQPPFDNVVYMTGKGFVYSLLFVLIAIVGMTSSLVAEGAFGAMLTERIGDLVGLLVGLGVLYFSPAIVTLYPATGSVAVALSPNRILDYAATQKYFVSFLVFSVVLLGVLVSGYLFITIIFSILLVGLYLLFFSLFLPALLIFVLGIFLLGFAAIMLTYAISVYLLYAAGSYWGATYREAVQEGLVHPPMKTQQRTRPKSPPGGREPVRDQHHIE